MAPPVVNAVYYPSWKAYRGKPPSTLPLQYTTHVLYAFIRIEEDGTFSIPDEFGDYNKKIDGEPGCVNAFAKLKRSNPNVKALVSVGGGAGSSSFPKAASREVSRQAFARDALAFCNRHNLNGVDIDWEHPKTPEEGRDYIKLLQTLRAHMPSSSYIVTSALPVGEYCLRNIDLRAATGLLDYLNLMGYDFTGSWTDVAGHHAQLQPFQCSDSTTSSLLRQSCAGGIKYVLSKGFPGSKILLGIPAYARYFTQAGGPGCTFKSSGEMDYCDLPAHWVEYAAVDEAHGSAHFVDDDPRGKGFVSFDVPRTVAMKARYAQDLGLGGLFYWTGVGDREGSQSLVKTGYEELFSAT